MRVARWLYRSRICAADGHSTTTGCSTLRKSGWATRCWFLSRRYSAGAPVVGLEPSCISVFREEMPNLLHGNEDAARLSKQSFLLSEFLAGKVPNYAPPKIGGKALVHGHCHHRSVLRIEPRRWLLKKTGLETVEVLESGCCGMAGAFGSKRPL